MAHKSVLLQEAIESLNLREGNTVFDATFGGGGHSLAIARSIGDSGHLIACDQDSSVFNEDIVRELSCLTRFTPVIDNFRHVRNILKKLRVTTVNGAIFDLGLSSTQLEESGRGFSFLRNEPLAMTFKHQPRKADVTAATIVNQWSEDSIRIILQGFGEERYARSIARKIVAARKATPIDTTGALVEIIAKATPGAYHRGRTHFATRTFQALRMAVNDELGAIEAGLTDMFPVMSSGGRIAVITFHSVEDRLVKRIFREKANMGIMRLVNKKPITATEKEQETNPRARSAKLRIAEKI